MEAVLEPIHLTMHLGLVVDLAGYFLMTLEKLKKELLLLHLAAEAAEGGQDTPILQLIKPTAVVEFLI
jgi:hypothetical protein